MTLTKQILPAFIAFGGGVISAGGFAAFITLIGIVPRLAGLTKTQKYIKNYERSLALGFILMNTLSLYPIQWEMPSTLLAAPLLAITGGFAGIFSGCLAGALAEVLEIFPIITLKYKMQTDIKYIIFAIALGKCAGSLIQCL